MRHYSPCCHVGWPWSSPWYAVAIIEKLLTGHVPLTQYRVLCCAAEPCVCTLTVHIAFIGHVSWLLTVTDCFGIYSGELKRVLHYTQTDIDNLAFASSLGNFGAPYTAFVYFFYCCAGRMVAVWAGAQFVFGLVCSVIAMVHGGQFSLRQFAI